MASQKKSSLQLFNIGLDSGTSSDMISYGGSIKRAYLGEGQRGGLCERVTKFKHAGRGEKSRKEITVEETGEGN